MRFVSYPSIYKLSNLFCWLILEKQSLSIVGADGRELVFKWVVRKTVFLVSTSWALEAFDESRIIGLGVTVLVRVIYGSLSMDFSCTNTRLIP